MELCLQGRGERAALTGGGVQEGAAPATAPRAPSTPLSLPYSRLRPQSPSPAVSSPEWPRPHLWQNCGRGSGNQPAGVQIPLTDPESPRAGPRNLHFISTPGDSEAAQSVGTAGLLPENVAVFGVVQAAQRHPVATSPARASAHAVPSWSALPGL